MPRFVDVVQHVRHAYALALEVGVRAARFPREELRPCASQQFGAAGFSARERKQARMPLAQVELAEALTERGLLFVRARGIKRAVLQPRVAERG